jgi:hypothetical protein
VLPVLSGVLPPAVQLVHPEAAGVRVVPVHVRDLELPAAGRLEGRDHLEHVARIAVETDDGFRGRRRVVARVDDPGLLDDVGDASVLAVDDDTEVLGVRDLLHEDQRVVR